jgi:hypothetical protein
MSVCVRKTIFCCLHRCVLNSVSCFVWIFVYIFDMSNEANFNPVLYGMFISSCIGSNCVFHVKGLRKGGSDFYDFYLFLWYFIWRSLCLIYNWSYWCIIFINPHSASPLIVRGNGLRFINLHFLCLFALLFGTYWLQLLYLFSFGNFLV